jgi:hypothetical protein
MPCHFRSRDGRGGLCGAWQNGSTSQALPQGREAGKAACLKVGALEFHKPDLPVDRVQNEIDKAADPCRVVLLKKE